MSDDFTYHTLSNDQVVKFPGDMPTKNRMAKIRAFELAIAPGSAVVPELGADIAAAGHGIEAVGPDAIRYGVPILAGLLSKNAWIVSAIDGVSEFGSRELKGYLESKEYGDKVNRLDTHGDNLLAGGAAAAIGLGMEKVVSPVASRIIHFLKGNAARVGRRLLVPADLADRSPEVLTANRVLARATADLGPKEVYGMTIGQINRGTNNLIEWLEDTMRSAIGGGGPFEAMNLRNRQAAEQLLNNWMRSNTKKVGREGFGGWLQNVVRGEEVDFVGAMRSTLYTKAKGIAREAGSSVNYSKAGKFLTARADQDEYRKAWRLIDDLFPGTPNHPSKANWDALTPDTALMIRQRLNKFWRKEKDPYQKRVYDQILKRIRPALHKSFEDTSPEAGRALKLADDYMGKTADRLNTELMKKFKRKLFEKPSTILESIAGPGGSHLDNLIALEKFFLGGAHEGVEKAMGRPATGLTREMWEEGVLEPIRHSIITEAYDKEAKRITGASLADALDKYDDSFILRVFGEFDLEHGAEYVRNLATTMRMFDGETIGSKMFIKLIQGGAVAGGAIGAMQGRPVEFGVGGLTIFLAPIAAGRLFRSKAFNQMLLDVASAGYRPSQIARLTAIIVGQNKAAQLDMQKMTADQRAFFSFPNDFATQTLAGIKQRLGDVETIGEAATPF